VSGYLAVLDARFRALLQYRAAAAAGFGTQLFWGLIRVMIYDAFYRSSTAPQPMSYQEVVTYIWLGQAMLGIILWGVDTDVRAMMTNGTVAYELLRPLDLYGLWYFRDVAHRTAPTLLRAVPMLVIAALFLGLPPPGLVWGAGWLLATAASVLLCSAFMTLVTISLLWTVSGDGVSRFVPALVYTLSGMLVPLPFFPDWARGVIDFLPFRGLADVPFRVYIGHIRPEQVLPALAHQLAWTVCLVLLGRWVLSRGLRRLVVQGG
jgi:ABC-2 type transport system permease protein